MREVCRALEVSPSGFYAHRDKDHRLRRRQDRVLAVELKSAFEQSFSTYGSPRLVRALRERGLFTSKTRVRRLMKSQGLCPRQKRRVKVTTTRSHPHWPVAPPVRQPGQRFHSDITYIPTGEGWLYTAATLDGYSRKCAGWSADDNMETSLVLRAAQRAFAGADADAGAGAAVHHSDRGSRYASEGFRNFLSDCDIVQSMSRRGNCYDNALMESFWATLKTECFDNFRSGIPQTRQQAKQQLFAYIEVFYNRKRLHSALNYQSPLDFERNHQTQHQTQNSQKEENPLLDVSA